MVRYDFKAPRLFVESDLTMAAAVSLARDQAHYLINVLRLGAGDKVLVFNGRHGEWLARIDTPTRKTAELRLAEQMRAQTPPGSISYYFAPLKQARLDYMAQKAVEMGAGLLAPVITRYTQAPRISMDRLRANAIEAAEQCGILSLPEIAEPRKLADLVDDWPQDQVLVFCDEEAEVADPLRALQVVAGDGGRGRPIAILIGPEGGFDPGERERLRGLPHVVRLSLGPRILRADTAAVAGLALVQAVLGDWA